ncbi:MAG: hypothetical protein ACI8V2_001115 [Candidatus Latescibacterota bacterium]|jgi:hypothetical protein
MRKIIESCPACRGDVAVTRISCTECDCEVTGHFQPTIFNRLSPESLAFVETFVRLRGNIKDMERELNIPYSSIRNRLDDVIGELGFVPGLLHTDSDDKPASHVTRREVLHRLEAGEITAGVAAEQLANLS